jgi:hypothetical protein
MFRTTVIVALIAFIMSWAPPRATAQVEFMGKVWIPRYPEAAANLPPDTGKLQSYFGPNAAGDPRDIMPLSNVRCFASLEGGNNEALQFRTWELAPTGWFRLMGMPGRYTLLFAGPSIYVRPTILTNMFMQQGDRIDLKVIPAADYAVFDNGKWDDKTATDYFQTFVAKSTSITNVGFRVVSDGIDGGGPGAQNLLVSVRKQGPGTPDTWEQVGPTITVFDVDSGGPKSYDWTAAWNSGEVPTTPGQTYAIHLRAEKPGNSFQMFWHDDGKKDPDCYRLGSKGQTGWRNRHLWMYVAGDDDGLLIPYNKRIQKEFLLPFAGFAKKWSQTYVAQGRGLAAVQLYAATSGSQPGIHRQRAVVRVHEGRPSGPVIGVQKIAIGNGIHTGDASWGTFGAAYAPGEVQLEPGKAYAVELESIENYESLHGYINIKGVASDERPGFNPYRKNPADKYEAGTAFKNGTEDVGFDLDMQIVEYQNHQPDWAQAVEDKNLIANGDMEEPAPADGAKEAGQAKSWKPFAVDAKTSHTYATEGADKPDHFLRVTAGSGPGPVSADGGYVQRISGLSHRETYRLLGQVRCSWPIDLDRGCMVGYDPTGQDSDPKASTIVWTPMVGLHSIWSTHRSEPIRPAGDAISVWLRGWTKPSQGYPFKTDFNDFALKHVRTDAASK